jgi:hypothetical protein
VYNEQALIAAFVKRSKRDRYRQIVSDPKHRWKWTTKLGHFSDFELRYRLPMEGRQLNRDRIARELLKRHSPTMVYAISEDPSLDGKEIPLHEALETIVGSGMGTILSCIPGRLAYVETEDERYILERNDPLERREYIRFVVGRKDEDSHVEQGVFQACYLAMEWREITGKDAAELSTLLRWFDSNLHKPHSLGRDKLRLGIAWFKTDAKEHISRIWEMVRILERNGIYVKKIRTDRPGYLVYEDDWQIIAEPFRKGTLGKR